MTVKSVVLFLSVLLVAATGLAAAQTACLEGTILDADGPPIAQMHVLASETTHPFFRTAITDENGHFTLTGLIPGTYDITTRNVDLGYPDSGDFHFTGTLDRLLVPVPASEHCTPLNIHRTRAGKLRIRLKDQSTGQTIAEPQANFRWAGHEGWDQVSLFGDILLVPTSRPLEVQVGAKGYQSGDIVDVIPLQPGEERTLALTLQPVGIGCLSGVVVDAAGKPVAGITVQPLLQNDPLNAKSALQTQTDERGKFQMDDLHPGVYELFVNSPKKGYDGFSTMRTYGHYPEAKVLPSTSCAEIKVSLTPPQARLQVRVVDAVTQRPIANFKVRVQSTTPAKGWEVNSITKEALVPPGKPCTLEVRAEGYRTSRRIPLGTFHPSEVRRMKIQLRPIGRAAATVSPHG
jgi:protocatechuate 3,4-dioxygenase beta subunit